MVPPCSDKVSRAPSYSKIKCLSTHTRLSLSKVGLSRPFWFLTFHRSAGPISLATTFGVSFDFLSSGYLDVSVPQVRFNQPMYSVGNIALLRWVAPFGHSRIKDCSHLPVTFRRVPRPSSPLVAKASTRCPSSSWFSLCVCKILHTIHKAFASLQIKHMLINLYPRLLFELYL